MHMGDVRVIKTFVGGGFGGKLEPTGLEFAGAVLAKLTGRPVRMFYDRAEMFAHNRGRHAQHMEITTGVDKEGKILGAHANFMMDGGAYTSLGIATRLLRRGAAAPDLRVRQLPASTCTGSTRTSRPAAPSAATARPSPSTPSRATWTTWPRTWGSTPWRSGFATPGGPTPSLPTISRSIPAR